MMPKRYKRNLIADYGMVLGKAIALREIMDEAFPDARVIGWEDIESDMTNHPKDRHVAAAAVVAEATIIVTSDTHDFAELPPDIVAMKPDQFLCELLRTTPDELLSALNAQVSAYRRPSLTISELLQRLSGIAPEFSDRALQAIASAKVGRHEGRRLI